VEAIDRQIEAYNAHDIDGFLAWYAPDAVIEDGSSNVLMRGIGEIRAEYEPFFRDFPSVHGEILQRMTAGAWTVDEEVITGWQPEPVKALVAYHVANDRIERVLLLS
jgi:hypothetical protein